MLNQGFYSLTRNTLIRGWRATRQIFYFGVVGVLTLGVDLLVTQTIYSFGVDAFYASACGFMSGFFVNFPLNRGKVFRHTDKDRFALRVQVVLYVLLSLFNVVATSLAVRFIVDLSQPIALAKIVVTVVFFFWNFTVFKFYIFSKSKGN